MTDFPALNHEPVTERHSRICREKGHATHKVDGKDTGICPRCGEVILVHTRRCISNSMIAAIENWRDDEYATDAEFLTAAQGKIFATAEGYLAEGLMTCICNR